ncbi:MAG: (Fe-S)-binding protein [Terriglobales bacterium]
MPPSFFSPPDAPRSADYDRCVRCGLCLNACPTYRVLGQELDSPRGRIYQVAQADQGRLPLEDSFRLHMDRCLDCRACMTACPSAVDYGAIIERTRAQLRAQHPLKLWQRWLLRGLIPRPRRRRAAARLIRWAQQSGLDRMGPPQAQLCPRLEGAPFAAFGRTFPAQGERRARVLFLPGCVQNELLPALNRATVRVLTRQGCDVCIPPAFGCCGALHVHAGEREFARSLARKNIAALESIPADAVLSNASGCGAQLKQYADLFDADPVWHARAAAFSSRVQDATEFLDHLGLRRELLGPLPAVATYQDACHLAHAQRIREAPRALLRQIPELELREMERSDQCCGSAGIYNLTQPAIAAVLAADRAAAFRATGATILATANPGCSLQLAATLPPPVTVAHVLELLDQSHRAAQR